MLEESSKGQLCPSGSLLWGFLWPCWQEVAQRLGLTLSRLTMIPGKFCWPVLPPPFLHQGEGCGPHVWGLVLPQNALALLRLSPAVLSRVHCWSCSYVCSCPLRPCERLGLYECTSVQKFVHDSTPMCMSLCVCASLCVPHQEGMCCSQQGQSTAPESSRFPESEGAQVRLNGDGTELLEICPGKRH